MEQDASPAEGPEAEDQAGQRADASAEQQDDAGEGEGGEAAVLAAMTAADP